MHVCIFIDVKAYTPLNHTDQAYQCEICSISYSNNAKMEQNATMTNTICFLYNRHPYILKKLRGYERAQQYTQYTVSRSDRHATVETYNAPFPTNFKHCGIPFPKMIQKPK